MFFLLSKAKKMECTVMITIGSSRTHLEEVDQPFMTRIAVAVVITSIRNSVISDIRVDQEAVQDHQLRREVDLGELGVVQEAQPRMLLRQTLDASQM